MRALLDVNVLIALLDADHLLHDRATAWYGSHAGSGWASCPITENGCVRIMSHPGYPKALPVQKGKRGSGLDMTHAGAVGSIDHESILHRQSLCVMSRPDPWYFSCRGARPVHRCA